MKMGDNAVEEVEVFEKRVDLQLDTECITQTLMDRIRAAAIRKSWKRCLEVDKLLWFYYGDSSKRTIQGTIWEIQGSQVENIDILVSNGRYNSLGI